MLEGIEDIYDYEAKNTVRDHWVPFAGRGVSREVLGKLIVWFLPGPRALEVPHYLKADLRVNQLRGFEWITERALAARHEVPGLAVEPRALRAFLASPRRSKMQADWAHLDFDGSVLSFAPDVREVVRRLRLENAPRLGICSLGSRDRPALIESIKALSLWCALGASRRDAFNAGIDLLRRGNEEAGLPRREPVATYMLCRELAASLLLIRSFGERAYGGEDEEAARVFRTEFARAEQAVDRAVTLKIKERLGSPRALPIAPLDVPELQGLRALFESRRIPVALGDRLRFAYQSTAGKWRWTWYWRFTTKNGRVTLARWVDALFLHHPTLHVVDFTGVVISDREKGVCEFCTKEDHDETKRAHRHTSSHSE